ncbi:hypothetical protein HY218_00700 [Candidatus Saccharibacteria bacterium]|nr:hypothetical protein [Candidatus Saccharibacteria bacterium]
MEDNRPPIDDEKTSLPSSSEKKRSFVASLQDKLIELFRDKTKRDRAEFEKQSPRRRKFLTNFRRRFLASWVKTEPLSVAHENTPQEQPSLQTIIGPEAEPFIIPKAELGVDDETGGPQPFDIDSQDTELSQKLPPETEIAMSTAHDQLDTSISASFLPDIDTETSSSVQPSERVAKEATSFLEQPMAAAVHSDHTIPMSESDTSRFESSQPGIMTPYTKSEVKRQLDRALQRESAKLKRNIKREQTELKEQLKQAQQIVRQQLVPGSIEQLKVIEHIAPDRESHPQVSREQSRRPEPRSLVSLLSSPETQPAEISFEKMIPQIKPVETILERIIEAADKNEPIEKRYEQRHEIKDQATPRGAVPIGQVMTEVVGHRTDQQPTSQLRSAESLRRTLAKQQAAKATTELYQTAMKRGFWTAIALLVMAVIAYFIVR